MHRDGIVAELQHVADDGDAAPLALGPGLTKRFQRRAHRGRVGVVAFVDQRERSERRFDLVPFSPPLRRLEMRHGEGGHGEIGVERMDNGQHGKRVHHDMMAGD